MANLVDRKPNVVVVGSINMDLVVRCANLPTPGETTIGTSATEFPGGKGANQAVAAARAGAEVTMVGRVGDDGFSTRLLDHLASDDIDVSLVHRTASCESGIAIVAVDDSGENSIIVIPGANSRITPEDVSRCSDRIRKADVLLLQLEIPIESVKTAMEIAHDASVPIILDPAPMNSVLCRPHCQSDLFKVDVLCPNQNEAEQIIGQPIKSIDDAKRAAATICDLGAKRAVVTMGEQGVVTATADDETWIKPLPVKAVDTTAAGDAFAGALAVRFADLPESATSIMWRDALQFACAAGAIATTRQGAQSAMATATEIRKRLSES